MYLYRYCASVFDNRWSLVLNNRIQLVTIFILSAFFSKIGPKLNFKIQRFTKFNLWKLCQAHIYIVYREIYTYIVSDSDKAFFLAMFLNKILFFARQVSIFRCVPMGWNMYTQHYTIYERVSDIKYISQWIFSYRRD